MNLGLNGDTPALLTISNSAGFAGTINVIDSGAAPTLGIYELASVNGTTSGTLTAGTLPANYRLMANGGGLDLVHLAGVAMSADSTSGLNVRPDARRSASTSPTALRSTPTAHPTASP